MRQQLGSVTDSCQVITALSEALKKQNQQWVTITLCFAARHQGLVRFLLMRVFIIARNDHLCVKI